MRAERFRAIETLFHRVSAQPPSARRQFLRQACADDDSLHRAVERLLQAEERADSQLEGVVRHKILEMAPELTHSPAPGSGHSAEPQPAGSGDGSLPQRVGPYRVLNALGRGGQGMVLLGERDDEAFRKMVAIKLLHRGLDTSQQQARFRRERDILARLEHPAIARVLDGGTTEDGASYVVMEHVEGRPIDLHCAERRLDVDAILTLFCHAARGVEAAHQQLVIHRDIKPSNLLVTDDGMPKLVDFGISELLTDEDVTAGQLTLPGCRPLTPSFASPEQLRGARLTTATDIYSLGVLLYNLLTGELPFALAGHRPAEIERIVSQHPPRIPSAVVKEAGRPAVARRLQGDLDTIVLKALRKEPGQRYGTVAGLVDDINRHRKGLPVRARPETLRYRLGKFLVRNRTSVAVAMIVLLGFVGLTAFYTLRLRTERDRASLEATRAARRAAEVQAATKLVTELFELAAPNTNGGDAVTARQLLDRGVELIRRMPENQPMIRGRLIGFLADVHLQHELYDEARTLLDERLRLARGHDHSVNRDVATTLAKLGKLELDRHRFAEAGAFLDQALAGLQTLATEATSEPIRQDILQVRLFQIELLQAQGPETDGDRLGLELADVVQSLRSLDTEERARLASGHPSRLEAERLLADALSLTGDQAFYDDDPARAVTRYRETLAIRQRIFGPLHLDLAETWNNLAVALAAAGQGEESLDARQHSLAIQRQLLGDESMRLAIGLSNLGTFQLSRGAAQEALDAYREALAMVRALRGEDHPNVAQFLRGTGYAMRDLGQIDGAAEAFRDSVALVRRNVVQGNATRWRLADALYRQGLFSLRQGRLGTARAALSECATLRRAERPTTKATATAECLVQALGSEGAPEIPDARVDPASARSLIERCIRTG